MDVPPSSTFQFSTESQRTKVEQDYLDAYVTIPPDGGWGWMVVAGAFFCFLLIDGMMCSFGIFLTQMANDLNVTNSQVSVTAAISIGVNCFTGKYILDEMTSCTTFETEFVNH